AVAAQEESAVEQPQAAGEAKAPGEANVPEQTGQDAAAPTEETDAVEMSAEAGAQAQREAGIAAVKKGFEKEFPGLVLDSVKPTRFAGIYELRIGTDLLYTNEQVQYVMQG